MLIITQTALVTARATNAIDAAEAQQIITPEEIEENDVDVFLREKEEKEKSQRPITGMRLADGTEIDFLTDIPHDIIASAKQDVWLRKE